MEVPDDVLKLILREAVVGHPSDRLRATAYYTCCLVCNNWRALLEALPEAALLRDSYSTWNNDWNHYNVSASLGNRSHPKMFKMTLIGSHSGKTTYVVTLHGGGKFPGDYISMLQRNPCLEMTDPERPQHPFRVSVWDTASSDDYDRLRTLAYPKTDAFLLFFDASCPLESLARIRDKYYPEIRGFFEGKERPKDVPPMVLVATKVDLVAKFIPPVFEGDLIIFSGMPVFTLSSKNGIGVVGVLCKTVAYLKELRSTSGRSCALM